VPRHSNPQLEPRILQAACRLWSRGGEKALTMRAVAFAAGTTTPTVYERFRDREDILSAVRRQTREDLFQALASTRTLAQACRRYLEFALKNDHVYCVLFDGTFQLPSLHEPWPSFNLFRQRLAKRLGGSERHQTRLMLSLWGLMHGTAMLVIRGRAEGALRSQMCHACMDAFENIIAAASRSRRNPLSPVQNGRRSSSSAKPPKARSLPPQSPPNPPDPAAAGKARKPSGTCKALACQHACAWRGASTLRSSPRRTVEERRFSAAIRLCLG
jgi:AcrR family transcriptional regulator